MLSFPFLIPKVGNLNFHSHSQSQNLGIIFFIPTPNPKNWEKAGPFPIPNPKFEKVFPAHTWPLPPMIYHHHFLNHTHFYKKCGGGESCKGGKCDGCKSSILKCFHSGIDGGGSGTGGAMEVVMLTVGYHWWWWHRGGDGWGCSKGGSCD